MLGTVQYAPQVGALMLGMLMHSYKSLGISFLQIISMIFIPLADIDRATHKDYTDFSQRITFGFKLLFALSTCSMILCVTVIPNLALANIPSATFGNFELWRIFTAPIATLEGFLGVMGLVMAFWWLLSLFPEYVHAQSLRKGSTRQCTSS